MAPFGTIFEHAGSHLVLFPKTCLDSSSKPSVVVLFLGEVFVLNVDRGSFEVSELPDQPGAKCAFKLPQICLKMVASDVGNTLVRFGLQIICEHVVSHSVVFSNDAPGNWEHRFCTIDRC